MPIRHIYPFLLFILSAAVSAHADSGTDSRLSLSGPITHAQLLWARDSIPQLEILDISAATLPGDSLPAWSLAGCPATQIILPSSLQHIGSYALAATATGSIAIPDAVRTIGRYAFAGSAITSVTISSNVTTIEPYVFKGCTSLVSVSCQASADSIPSGLFAGCTSLSAIDIGPAFTSVGDNAFLGSAIETIDLSLTHITHIGNYAFAQCRSLAAVIMPERLTSIGAGAFLGCTSLSAIALPGSLSFIGTYAMAGTANLTEIDANATAAVPALGLEVWRGINCENVDLLVPESLRHDYSTSPQWCNFHIPNFTGLDPVMPYDSSLIVRCYDGIMELRSDSSPISELRILNAGGQCIYTAGPDSGTHTVNTSAWPHNIYIITASLADGRRAVAKVAL